MTHAEDTIRVLIPLNVRKKNGRLVSRMLLMTSSY